MPTVTTTIGVRVGAGEDLPFDDDSFELIFSLGSTEHAYDFAKMLQEARRVLVPGGWFLIRWRSEKLWGSPLEYYNHNHLRFFTPRTWELALRRYGFSMVDSTDVEYEQKPGEVYIMARSDLEPSLDDVVAAVSSDTDPADRLAEELTAYRQEFADRCRSFVNYCEEANGDVTEIARAARAGELGYRILLGDDDWVIRRESGVDYGYRMTLCMFSSGNVNERRRMGEVTQQEEIVVDLYAGIGYYTLPALVHGGASLVHACEWNPEAIKALEWGLESNGVNERCVVHEGDSKLTSQSLEGVADRVFLGLLPSSEDGLEAALRVLNTDGGTLHIHGLAPSSNHSSWAERVCASVSAIRPGSSIGSGLVRVKSYAPHWDHVVLDLSLA